MKLRIGEPGGDPRGPIRFPAEARAALFDYIEVFYNRQRLHSGINYARPISRAA